MHDPADIPAKAGVEKSGAAASSRWPSPDRRHTPSVIPAKAGIYILVPLQTSTAGSGIPIRPIWKPDSADGSISPSHCSTGRWARCSARVRHPDHVAQAEARAHAGRRPGDGLDHRVYRQRVQAPRLAWIRHPAGVSAPPGRSGRAGRLWPEWPSVRTVPRAIEKLLAMLAAAPGRILMDHPGGSAPDQDRSSRTIVHM